jgi:hypothetical protein
LTKDKWNKIYEYLFGGFESLVANEDEDDDEEDELESLPKNRKTRDGYLKDGFVVDGGVGCDSDVDVAGNADENGSDDDADDDSDSDSDSDKSSENGSNDGEVDGGIDGVYFKKNRNILTKGKLIKTKQKNKSSIFDKVFNILNYALSYDSCDSCGSVEELSLSNLLFPTEYEQTDEITEEYDVSYLYNTPTSVASEYQGRKVTLNKPFRTPGGPKKFAVYVKNNKGKVVIVRFGDPNLSIKRDDPKRRKSFRARHKCDKPAGKDRCTARYWSCYQWRAGKKVEGE